MRDAFIDSGLRREAHEPGRADLSLCDQEPIRTPGAIQPHGRLLVLLPRTLGLVAFSENWPAAEVDEAREALRQFAFDELAVDASPLALGAFAIGGMAFDACAHRSADHLIVEFEPASSSAGHQAPIYSLARVFLPQLHDAGSIEQRAVTKNGIVTTTVSCAVEDISTDQLKALLQDIETAEKVVAVTHLDVKRDRRDTKKIDVTLEISTYSNATKTEEKKDAESEKKEGG